MKLGRQFFHNRPAPPPVAREVPTPPEVEFDVPKATALGTQIALVILAMTALLLSGDRPSELGRFGAYGATAALIASILCDARRGLRNLVRADLMAIAAFYFLTLFEFLFPQNTFDLMNRMASTRTAVLIVLLGLAGLFAGRHIFHPKQQPFAKILTGEVPASWMIAVFWGAFGIAFAYMLAAVNGNVFAMVDAFMQPRFTQPWQRGRFGDWRALLFELNMLVYLIPPLGGVILGRRQRYGKGQLAGVVFGLLFVFFYGFSSGTRNLFASFLVTFLIGYVFAIPWARRREIMILCASAVVVLIAGTTAMLEFRQVGLKEWVKHGSEYQAPAEGGVFVDYNLWAIAQLAEVFPSQHAYLGWEIPYLALVRPIPRALWPGKPEGMSFTIEDAVGASDMTVAASFAGEAYMSAGLLGVALAALFFGAGTAWWNHLFSSKNSELGILIYASGFFCAVISMRSLLVFSTALLPTLSSFVICAYVMKVLGARALLLARRLRHAPPARRGPREAGRRPD